MENFIVVFDNPDYTVVWGKYRDIRALGVKWKIPGQDTWHVEPDFLALAILSNLRTLYSVRGEGSQFITIDYLEIAQKELTDQYPERDN